MTGCGVFFGITKAIIPVRTFQKFQHCHPELVSAAGFDPIEVRIRGFDEVRDHDLGRATKDRSLQRSASPSKRKAAFRAQDSESSSE